MRGVKLAEEDLCKKTHSLPVQRLKSKIGQISALNNTNLIEMWILSFWRWKTVGNIQCGKWTAHSVWFSRSLLHYFYKYCPVLDHYLSEFKLLPEQEQLQSLLKLPGVNILISERYIITFNVLNRIRNIKERKWARGGRNCIDALVCSDVLLVPCVSWCAFDLISQK